MRSSLASAATLSQARPRLLQCYCSRRRWGGDGGSRGGSGIWIHGRTARSLSNRRTTAVAKDDGGISSSNADVSRPAQSPMLSTLKVRLRQVQARKAECMYMGGCLLPILCFSFSFLCYSSILSCEIVVCIGREDRAV